MWRPTVDESVLELELGIHRIHNMKTKTLLPLGLLLALEFSAVAQPVLGLPRNGADKPSGAPQAGEEISQPSSGATVPSLEPSNITYNWTMPVDQGDRSLFVPGRPHRASHTVDDLRDDHHG